LFTCLAGTGKGSKFCKERTRRGNGPLVFRKRGGKKRRRTTCVISSITLGIRGVKKRRKGTALLVTDDARQGRKKKIPFPPKQEVGQDKKENKKRERKARDHLLLRSGKEKGRTLRPPRMEGEGESLGGEKRKK